MWDCSELCWARGGGAAGGHPVQNSAWVVPTEEASVYRSREGRELTRGQEQPVSRWSSKEALYPEVHASRPSVLRQCSSEWPVEDPKGRGRRTRSQHLKG